MLEPQVEPILSRRREPGDEVEARQAARHTETGGAYSAGQRGHYAHRATALTSRTPWSEHPPGVGNVEERRAGDHRVTDRSDCVLIDRDITTRDGDNAYFRTMQHQHADKGLALKCHDRNRTPIAFPLDFCPEQLASDNGAVCHFNSNDLSEALQRQFLDDAGRKRNKVIESRVKQCGNGPLRAATSAYSKLEQRLKLRCNRSASHAPGTRPRGPRRTAAA